MQLDSKNIKGIIESVLFAAGEAVKADKLSQIIGAAESEIKEIIKELTEEYSQNMRGFSIIEIDNGYQICTRPQYYSYVQAIVGARRQQGLSNAAMETLAIVAYNQPVTRSTIEYVRGVNSDGSVVRLVERGLIEEKGRLDAPGRPILYVTTNEFLRAFGLKSLEELPDIGNVQDIENQVCDQMQIEI